MKDNNGVVRSGVGIYVFSRMNVEDAIRLAAADSTCSRPLCPLNQVKAGLAVRIKQLCAAPELANRLREIGFCEERIIKLLTSHNNIICLVCNTRLALSEQLAQAILVEPLQKRVAT